MWFCIYSGRRFEETFENAQWRKVKQMQPMHYGLSNVIIRDQKFAKVRKSKPLLLAHFWTKRAQFFFKRSKTGKILQQIFFKCFSIEKNWNFWHWMAKNLNGWSHKLETLHVETLGTNLKKPWKQKNYGGSRSLWNLHLKYTNIFPNIFLR